MNAVSMLKCGFSSSEKVSIEVVGNKINVFFCDTKIAEINDKNKKMRIFPSPQTKRYINKIFKLIGVNAFLYQKNYIMRIAIDGVDFYFFDGLKIAL